MRRKTVVISPPDFFHTINHNISIPTRRLTVPFTHLPEGFSDLPKVVREVRGKDSFFENLVDIFVSIKK